MVKVKGLGRGLDALLSGSDEPTKSGDVLCSLAVNALKAGRYQPRTHMNSEALEELERTIGSRTQDCDSQPALGGTSARYKRRKRIQSPLVIHASQS